MLIQARDGVIEGNRIERVMAAAIQMTTDAKYWQEGYGCENVVVRGNTLVGCNYAMWERHAKGRHMACVSLVVDTETGLGDYPAPRNIIIEGNTIQDTPGLAILVASASGVIVRGNRIIDANTQPFPNTGAGIDAKAQGSIMITRARDVTVSGNTFETTRKTHGTGVFVDERNTSKVIVSPDGERVK